MPNLISPTRPEALLPADEGRQVLAPERLAVHEVPKELPPRRRLEQPQLQPLRHLREIFLGGGGGIGLGIRGVGNGMYINIYIYI